MNHWGYRDHIYFIFFMNNDFGHAMFHQVCCLLNFFADVSICAYGSLSKQSMGVRSVFLCVSVNVLFVCESPPQMWYSCSFLLFSWCPLISWCCRGFQNGAGGSGISFHCHDNDNDTLAPSSTQTSHCMETGM